MDEKLYNQLINQVKEFEEKSINLPSFSEQQRYTTSHIINSKEKYTLVVNRKGHRNKENLTILINSEVYRNILIRFDVNGSDHFNYNNNKNIPTPHLHIFSDKYSNGQIAIPLSEVHNKPLVDELIDGLNFFLDYSNIKKDNILINRTLF